YLQPALVVINRTRYEGYRYRTAADGRAPYSSRDSCLTRFCAVHTDYRFTCRIRRYCLLAGSAVNVRDIEYHVLACDRVIVRIHDGRRCFVIVYAVRYCPVLRYLQPALVVINRTRYEGYRYRTAADGRSAYRCCNSRLTCFCAGHTDYRFTCRIRGYSLLARGAVNVRDIEYHILACDRVIVRIHYRGRCFVIVYAVRYCSVFRHLQPALVMINRTRYEGYRYRTAA